MIRDFATRASKADVHTLREHLRREQSAIRQPDVRGRTRLLADFHVKIAAIMGNDVLVGVLAQLVSRTSLAAMLYQTRLSAEHSSDEHVALLDAIEKRDPEGAAGVMERHLENVEASLQLDSAYADIRLALVGQVTS
jgi:DNA-binding GntR family transcriptional regulator